MATESDEPLSNERLFNERLCARVRELRDGLGWTAAQMAIVLGIPADRYRKYEKRSPMPAYLMPKFCLVTGTTVEELIGEKPLRQKRRPDRRLPPDPPVSP